MGSENEISQNLLKVRKAMGLTQAQLAEKLGKTPQAVSQWEKNAEWNPSVGKLKEIANALGVSYRSLTGIEPGDSTAPVIGNISAGAAVEAIPRDGDRTYVSPTVLGNHPEAFFLAVTGDSMDRLFPAGMLVLVDPREEVRSGDVAVVNVNGDDATIKRVLFAGDTMILHPESTNPRHRDCALDSDGAQAGRVRVIGKVVWATFPDRIRF